MACVVLVGCSDDPNTPPDDDTGGQGGASSGGQGGLTGGDGGQGASQGGGGGGGEGGRPVGCGDGVVEASEACDEGDDNGAPTSCCTAGCQLVVAGTVCRPGSGDLCDADEVCDGSSAACPADVFADGTVECRADADGADGCDAAEVCPGVSGQACPPDGSEPDGTACTGNGAGDCSAADTCLAGQCADNDAAAATPCGTEPTCNPEVCDGAGTCVDVASLPDGASCADGGGDTCCAGECVTGLPSQGNCCGLPAPGVLTVDIIESLSGGFGHEMAAAWHGVAQSLGHVATIQPQSFLDDVANLANTDILVVSSGTYPLSATGVATVLSYLQSGGGVYLQGEYLTTYQTNQAFAQIVNATGGTFVWNDTVVGDLQPVQTLGCLAVSPEVVPPLDYFWYGANATTSTAEPILTAAGGQEIGWSWCLPGAGNGLIVHTTDQDFINNAGSEDLTFMRNVLRRLAFPQSCD